MCIQTSIGTPGLGLRGQYFNVTVKHELLNTNSE